MSEKGLQGLMRKSLVPLAKIESLPSCDHYLVGKQYRVSNYFTTTKIVYGVTIYGVTFKIMTP